MNSPAPVSKPSSSEAQVKAWFYALTAGRDSRDRLAEALTEGADPWSTMAVTRGWRVTGSTTLIEAVMNAEPTLGREETIARMGLLSRYASPSEGEDRDPTLHRILIQGVQRRWPLPALDEWLDKTYATQRFSQEAFPLLKERVLTGGNDSVEVLRWTHRHIHPLAFWEPQDIQALESTDNTDLRDAYWALRRQATLRVSRS